MIDWLNVGFRLIVYLVYRLVDMNYQLINLILVGPLTPNMDWLIFIIDYSDFVYLFIDIFYQLIE